jgi:peptidoglycan/xylan/chitin deacetylase (PgdA/CDA1 family)
MPIRFALLPLLLALSFPTCKKSAQVSGTPPPSSPTPASSAAAAAAPSATAAPVTAKPPLDQAAQVVVFGYHRFVNKVRRPDTEITPAAFEAQMQQLKERGIAVIGMQDFLAWKRGEKTIPPKCAVLTFDDGWKSQYEVAWPIVKKYGYPVTLFIYTEGVRGGRFGGGEASSWEQLMEMRDAGVDIQAHSRTHQDLRKPYDKVTKRKLTPAEYEQWLEDEVAGSKQALEQKLGIKVNCFAVPFGNINDRVREMAKKAGYEAIFTVYGQPLSYGSPNESLGRYLIEASKPKVFVDAIKFGGSSSAGSAPVAEIAATNITTEPADGATIKSPMPLLKANVSPFGAVEPGSIQMRVSGLGLVPASFDAKTQTVSYQVTQKLRDRSCTVILGAKAGGKRVETRWSFTIDEHAASAGPAATASPQKP